MRKVVRIMAVVMVVLMVTLVLAACGKTLSGTYSAETFGTGKTFEFSGNKVSVTYKVVGFNSDPIEGTYEIKDDKITFDFVDESDVENDDLKSFLSGLQGSLDFEEGDGYIKIGGVKYEKK